MYYDLMEDYGKLLRIRNCTDNPVKREVYTNRLREIKATMDYFHHYAVNDDALPEHESITPAFIIR